MALQPASDAIIRVRDITVQFGTTRILDGLNLDVMQTSFFLSRRSLKVSSRSQMPPSTK